MKRTALASLVLLIVSALVLPASAQSRAKLAGDLLEELNLGAPNARVIVTYEAEAEEKTSEDVVQAVLDHVPVP